LTAFTARSGDQDHEVEDPEVGGDRRAVRGKSAIVEVYLVWRVTGTGLGRVYIWRLVEARG
jgi:hypothetical protein